jgi:hypothetical protein
MQNFFCPNFILFVKEGKKEKGFRTMRLTAQNGNKNHAATPQFGGL